MPKLSGLTTEGEATVPLGDLSPYTEEELLERVHRVHILFACMDCKKSWVELKEMLRHMVDGGCTGEETKTGIGSYFAIIQKFTWVIDLFYLILIKLRNRWRILNTCLFYVDKSPKRAIEDTNQKENLTDDENEFPMPYASPPRTRSSKTCDRSERKKEKKSETKVGRSTWY